MKIFVSILVLVVVLVGAYLLIRQHVVAPVVERSGLQKAEPSFRWRFEEATSTNQDLPPRTSVALIAERDGNIYDAGTYAGSCAPIEPANLLPDEISAVLCWYAGGGDEIGVFKDGKTYAVKLGSQEEPTAETAGTRGGFKNLFTL